MQNSIEAVASSMEALTEQYRTITQNLANASTPGYKRRVNAFSQLLAEQNGSASTRVQDTIAVDYSQGSLNMTGTPLDLAANGKGFFELETPNGPMYTRSGSFRLNSQGQIVDSSGRMVSGEGGPIVVPQGTSVTKIHISSDGSVFAGSQSIGKIKIVEFTDTTKLVPLGENLFRDSGAGASPAAKTTVQQGFTESSNVNVVEELVGLITVTRLYEANLKNVQVQDERLKSLLGVTMR